MSAFDGDYATATCACGDYDPLQTCVEACLDALVHDRWLVRRLPRLVRAAGFDLLRFRSYSYVEAPSREGLHARARRSRGRSPRVVRPSSREGGADALKAEARRRSDAGEFFGHIAYASLLGRKPG